MGEGDRRLDLAQVDLDGADIFGVGVSLVSGIGAVHAAVHILAGDVIHGEDAILGPGLDGHVGDAQTVVHGQGGHALAAVFQALVKGAVHADGADKVEDHVLAGYTGLEFALEGDLDGGGDAEPGQPRGHARGHIGGAHASGEHVHRAVGAGVGVGADDAVAGGDQALFRQQGVLDAHLAHVIEIVDVEAVGKGAALETLLGGLDVLVGGKVVHDHGDLALVKDPGEAFLVKLPDGDGRGDVVAQHHV